MSKKEALQVGYTTLPINKLVKAPWNYKYNDAVLMQKLRENIKENGQIENLIVRELDSGVYEVVNGNHRLDVLIDLKITEAHCYNLGKMPDNRAKRIAIETNETKFPVDSLKLSDILKQLMSDFTLEDLVITMPYSMTELESLMRVDLDLTATSVSGDPSNDLVEAKAKEKTPLVNSFYCPKCGFKYETLKPGADEGLV